MSILRTLWDCLSSPGHSPVVTCVLVIACVILAPHVIYVFRRAPGPPVHHPALSLRVHCRGWQNKDSSMSSFRWVYHHRKLLFFSLWLISSSILKFLKQYQFRFPQSQLLPWTCHMALRVPLVGESLLLLFYCCLSFLIVLFPSQVSPSPSTAGCGTGTSSPSSPRSIFTRSRASREVTRGVTSASPGTAWAASSVRWSPSPSPVSRIS